YTLVYAYDRQARTVSWEPKLGKHGGVSGSASFEPKDGGTQLVYAIEAGPLREPIDLQALVDAFVRRMK
ncbi:MAG TPA: hypothetical protein VGC41_19475, partial [Kofleriaceae bacterium]